MEPFREAPPLVVGRVACGAVGSDRTGTTDRAAAAVRAIRYAVVGRCACFERRLPRLGTVRALIVPSPKVTVGTPFRSSTLDEILKVITRFGTDYEKATWITVHSEPVSV